MSALYRGSEADMPPRELCAAFTGHRPKGLPWGCDESDPRCVSLKEKLRAEIIAAYSRGARYFLSGMAEGTDLYAAEAVLELKRTLPDIELIAVFPYGSGNSPRQRRAAARAVSVVSIAPEYDGYCMMARNGFLARHCGSMICVFSGDTQSGTAATMRMASREGAALTILAPGE